MMNISRTVSILAAVGFSCGSAFAASVTIAWDANSEPNLEGYNIYYKSDTASEPAKVEVGNETSITLPDLVAGERYTIYATAYNTVGLESDPSEPVFYTPPVSTQGPEVDLRVENGSIVLSGSELSAGPVILQAATSLNSPEWVDVQTITAGADGSVEVPILEHGLNPRRFYRLYRP